MIKPQEAPHGVPLAVLFFVFQLSEFPKYYNSVCVEKLSHPIDSRKINAGCQYGLMPSANITRAATAHG